MGYNIHNPAAIAAIVILLLVVVLVRARALLTRRTRSRGATTRSSRRLNTPVASVPLSGVHVQRANHGEDDTVGQAHHPLAHHPPASHHPRPVNSVTSVPYPPPAYPAHHLDTRYDGVAYGYAGIPVGSTVNIVLAPLPPSYTTHSGGDHLPFDAQVCTEFHSLAPYGPFARFFLTSPCAIISFLGEFSLSCSPRLDSLAGLDP